MERNILTLDKLLTFLTKTKNPKHHKAIKVDDNTKRVLQHFMQHDIGHGERATQEEIYRRISESIQLPFNTVKTICRNLESEHILGDVRESSFPTYTYSYGWTKNFQYLMDDIDSTLKQYSI